MKYQKFLSIDPGFTRLGFASWDNNNLIDCGAIGPSVRRKDEPWAIFFERGIEFFRKWLYDQPSDLEMILLELVPPVSSSPGFKASPQTPLVHGVVATIINFSLDRKIPVNYVASQHWKNIVFDDPKISKAQTRRKIVEEFNFIKKTPKLGDIPFDLTDAISIGKYWIKENG